MKVQVLQEELSRAVSVCSRFSSSRVQLPVLANILLETNKNKLRLSATNLEVSVSISIGAKIETEGAITIPSKVLLDLISNLKSGPITLTGEKEILEIKSDEFESRVSGMNSLDFPQVPNDIGAGSIKIEMSKFKESLEKILFSVSTDEARPVLTGVLLILKEGEIVMVATDGFRLSQSKIALSDSLDKEKGLSPNADEDSLPKNRFIIPKSILSEVVRIQNEKTVEFLYKKADNQIIFSVGNMVMASRVIEGDFPDFEKIIPKNTKIKLFLDKHEFMRLIKLASVFAKDSANVIKINIRRNTLEVLAESSQHGSQKGKCDVKIEGLKDEEDFTIAFNYRFVEEFLGVLDNDDLEVDFTEPSLPSLFIDPKDTNFFHIIMPVRIQS